MDGSLEKDWNELMRVSDRMVCRTSSNEVTYADANFVQIRDIRRSSCRVGISESEVRWIHLDSC